VEPIQTVPAGVDPGAFHEVQKAAGASFYEDYGRLWTRSFGDPVSEYWSVRHDVGLWDVYALIKWRFTGPDAMRALDRLTTRHMPFDTAPGTIRYAMMLDENGAMLDEGTNFVLASQEVYFMGNDDREPFAGHLAKHTADLDVEVENATARIPNIAVQGPRSLELLSGLTETDLGSLGYFKLIPRPVELAGVPGLISRTGFTGELGYEFFLLDGPEGSERLWDSIIAAGAHPFGLDAIEMLRIEMGLVIAEEDYFPGETNPHDLSMDQFIDFDEHDFIGKKAAVATSAMPPRRFKTLAIEGDDVPEIEAPVTNGGRSAGMITSTDLSPRYGVLALAVLDTPVAVDGRSLKVDGREATVRPLPMDAQGRARSDPRNPARIEE
jgi:aminomethyltransferase